jgi:hypothetical protein
VTLNEDAKQQAITTVNSNQPRNIKTVWADRIVCAGRLTTGGDKRTTEPPVHTGVLEMACCERAMDLGREHSSDASLPLVTAQYKGNRNLRRSDEDSAGHVVPFEGTGQQNPC